MKVRTAHLSVVVNMLAFGLSSTAFASFLDVANSSFEEPVITGGPATPTGWNLLADVSAYNSLAEYGFAAADGSNVILCSQSNGFRAVYQNTSNALKANTTYQLGVALGSRTGDAGGLVTWGGDWLRLQAVDASGNSYCLANTYGQGTDPGRGNWNTVSTSVTIGDLSHVAVISNGYVGTVPDGVADLSGGSYKLQILVGANDPGGAQTAYAQTILDHVTLTGTAVPEPCTMVLVGTGVLAYAWRRRK